VALHDALTGLPNRALILDRIGEAMAQAGDVESVALMFLDLDDFKSVNDTFGHAAGDQLLQAVAERIAATLRVGDIVARLGGDEFVVLLQSCAVDSDPPVIADRIRSVLAKPFVLPGSADMAVHAQVSVGIATGVRASAEELLRDADVALYEAKSTGKDRHVVFVPAMQAAVHERLHLKADLRDAIGTDQFFLLYQPILDLRTLNISSVEALLRWRHPVRGQVMPDAFIPAAEESGLIVPLGRWVLFKACREIAGRQVRHPGLGLSVNVSARQLDTDEAFLDTVRDALLDSGLDPDLLTLEITETMLMRDAATSAQRLHALKRLGVRIAIDDFGTGYSSMAYLQQFPVDMLKIDRSFVSGPARTTESAALIRTIVQLGAILGIETVAEGIEDASQLHELQQEGCHLGQGYLFARPLTTSDLDPFLAQLDPAGTIRLLPAGTATA
jgi:diguanylate cyclase (GGDEF)-like protein